MFRRHSERSEESLFGGNSRKEGFLTPAKRTGRKNRAPKTPFGMTESFFFRTLLESSGVLGSVGHKSFDRFYGLDAAAGSDSGAIERGGGAGELQLALQ